MTTAIAAQSGAGFLAGVEPNAGMLAGVRRSWRSYRAYRTTLAELAALTDRQLSDTGFARSTLKATVHRAVYGK